MTLPWRERLGLPDTTGQRAFLTAMAVDAVGSGAFFPFTFLYFTVTTDLSLTHIGLALTLASLGSVPFGPWFGSLTDRYGARPVSMFSNVLHAAGLLGYLVAHSFPVLLLTSLVFCIGDRAFWASYGTFVGEVAAPGERARWFGLLSSIRNFGLGLGGLAGGVLVTTGGTTGPHVVVLVDAASFAVCAWLLVNVRTRRAPGTHDASPGAWSIVLHDRGYLGLVGANVLLTTGLFVLGFLPVYVVDILGLPGWLAGGLFTLNCALIVVLQTTAVRLSESHRRTRMLALAAVLLAGSCAVFLAASQLPRGPAIVTVVLGCIVYTLGEIAFSPAADSLAAEAAPQELRGRYLSVYQLSWTVSVTLGPVLAGWLLDTGPVPLWTVFGVIVLSGGAAMLVAERGLPAHALRGGRQSTATPLGAILTPGQGGP
jgi:MFS family permease